MTKKEQIIEHEGIEYTVRVIDPKNPPVRVLKALEENHPVGALEVMLGEVQSEQYLNTDPLADSMSELISKILGTDVGKSSI